MLTCPVAFKVRHDQCCDGCDIDEDEHVFVRSELRIRGETLHLDVKRSRTVPLLV